jgi:N-acetylglucosaminyldiphosphoundecaprenol N-acetyl-beta-D-mannosaminyltransferase
MRRAGLEWLFRLIRQPWRARRMAVLPLFALEVLRLSWGRGNGRLNR